MNTLFYPNTFSREVVAKRARKNDCRDLDNPVEYDADDHEYDAVLHGIRS